MDIETYNAKDIITYLKKERAEDYNPITGLPGPKLFSEIPIIIKGIYIGYIENEPLGTTRINYIIMSDKLEQTDIIIKVICSKEILKKYKNLTKGQTLTIKGNHAGEDSRHYFRIQLLEILDRS